MRQLGTLVEICPVNMAWLRRIELIATWLIPTLMIFGNPGLAAGQCSERWLTSPEQVVPGTNFEVFALATLANGDLVAGGNFTTAGGVVVNKIARWNGGFWSSLGTGVAGSSGPFVHAIAQLSNGDIVAAGQFTSAGGVAAKNVARWNGSSWAPLGEGLVGQFGTGVRQVFALAVLQNGDLVAGGYFGASNGTIVSNIALERLRLGAAWDGNGWCGVFSCRFAKWRPCCRRQLRFRGRGAGQKHCTLERFNMDADRPWRW